MTLHRITRVARMTPRELLWRSVAGGRIAIDRVRTTVAGSHWERRALYSALTAHSDLTPARAALAGARWDDAHRELSAHFARAPQRFAISPRIRAAVATRIKRECPGAEQDAVARADRIIRGDYDLLGYEGLRFDDPPSARQPQRASGRRRAAIDWHYDPVHERAAPRAFWSAVPYLDPSCGDHKIVWELNRHQHWLKLGRAYWLTGHSHYRRACYEQLGSWMEANAPLVGINWASMLELALRCLSWIWALNLFADADADDSAPWTVDLLLGLDRQLTHIERNLSHYFSPNTHLLGEALALYVAGRTLPELAASRRREAIGRRILVREIDRQIGSDGGHRERSTHYQRYTLDFYLLALITARITDDPVASLFQDAAARLAFAARLLADDTGRVPHIGDDDGGALFSITGRPVDDLSDSLAIAAALVERPDVRLGSRPEEACWLLSEPHVLVRALESSRSPDAADHITSSALTETGYYVSRSANGDHLVIDGGPHGYQNGGHAHADALALTFTRRCRPLLIDGGTACYTTDSALRDRMRSTAMHNSVEIDHQSQSVPRGPFHWARTAQSRVVRWRTNERFDYFEGAHDGYDPLEHRRHVFVMHGDLLVVADHVQGAGAHDAAVYWHVDPSWQVTVQDRTTTMTVERERVGIVVAHGRLERFTADRESGLGWYSPIYGRLDPATTLRITHRAAAPFWMVSVLWMDDANPAIEVDTLPVWAEAGVLNRATAIRIRRAISTDYVVIAEPLDDRPHTHWRVADIDTDARMAYWRTAEDARITRMALVDGSFAAADGRPGVRITLPRSVSDMYADLERSGDGGPRAFRGWRTSSSQGK